MADPAPKVDPFQFVEMTETLKHVAKSIDEIKNDLRVIRTDYITRRELDYEIKSVKSEVENLRMEVQPVKILIYKGVGIVLAGVLIAVLGLVIIANQ